MMPGMITRKKSPLSQAIWLLAAALFLLLAIPAHALASAAPAPASKLVIPSLQFWTAALAALAPLGTYVLNRYAPWADERVKAIVHVVMAAAVGVVYPLIATGGWAFDTRHLELVGSAVISALIAHRILWMPSGISTALGAGTNAPVRSLRRPAKHGTPAAKPAAR